MTDRPRALAVLITVFLLGCIVGSAGFYFWFGTSQEVPDIPVANGRGGPPPMPERPKLPDLQLTPEQEERFGEIILESRKQTEPLLMERQELMMERQEIEKELRAKQRPKFNEIWAETNRKVRDILTEEQKAKYDAFWKESEEMRKRPPRGRGFEPRGRGNSKPPQ